MPERRLVADDAAGVVRDLEHDGGVAALVQEFVVVRDARHCVHLRRGTPLLTRLGRGRRVVPQVQ